jgi:ABC-2 type transport system ATP-binding protein
VVLTTHYLEEAEELADRVGIINEGRLLLVEDKRALMRRMGEKRLVVSFSTAVTRLPDACVEGGSLADDGRSLVYTERNGRARAGEVLRGLYAAGLPVAEVETRASRLEDVLIEVLHGRGGAAGA